MKTDLVKILKRQKSDKPDFTEKGNKIPVWSFIEYAASKNHTKETRNPPNPRGRLVIGDYLIFPDVINEDFICIDTVIGVNQPEKGDFLTIRGTTGPIDKNIFIQRNSGILLVGEKSSSYDEGSIPRCIERYKEKVWRTIHCLGEDIATEILPSEYGLDRSIY